MFVLIAIIALPNLIGQTGSEDSIKIDNLEMVSRKFPDSTYISNAQGTDRVKSTWYQLEVKAQPQKTYFLIFRAINIILVVLISIFIFKILLSLKYDNPFITKLDVWLNRTGLLLIISWINSHVFEIVMNPQIKKMGLENFAINEKSGGWLFCAVLAFAFAQIFKKGKEYKEENDLTV